jgi:hypothetical protein
MSWVRVGQIRGAAFLKTLQERFNEIRRDFWSGREDLNLRLHGPEPCALPSCATPRTENSRTEIIRALQSISQVDSMEPLLINFFDGRVQNHKD